MATVTPWHIALVLVTVLGWAVTIGGLWRAYRSARRRLRSERERIPASKRLAAAEEAAMKEQPATAERSAEIHAYYENLFAARGLLRPSMGEAPYLAAHEAVRLAGLLLDDARSNLVAAGAGLTLSTAASVVSLFPL